MALKVMQNVDMQGNSVLNDPIIEAAKEHLADGGVHVTADEKAEWNAKPFDSASAVAFFVGADGHLYMDYNDGVDPSQFSIENGHLIMEVGG